MLRGPRGVSARECAVLGRRPVRGWLLALLAVSLAACGQGDDGSAHAEKTAPPPPAVTVAQPLVQQLTEYDEFTGRFEPFKRVDVRARVSGYLQSINFTDGQIVEAGQLLFVVDPQALSGRRRAGAGGDRQRQGAGAAGRAPAQPGEHAREQLGTVACHARSTAGREAAGRRRSRGGGGASRPGQARPRVTPRCRAPIKGRISDRRVDVGNLVTGDPSATLLTTIVALDPIYFVFDMSETDFLGYQRAVLAGKLPSTRDHRTPIAVRLTDEEDWPHQGTMDFVDNEVDQGTGTLRARAVVANPDYFITPGQFGRLRLPGSPLYPAILIPESAILTDQSRKVVMTVGADGAVAPTRDPTRTARARAQDRSLGPEARRPHRHRRAHAGAAGCQGDAGARQDRAGRSAGRRLSRPGTGPCASPTSSSTGRSSRRSWRSSSPSSAPSPISRCRWRNIRRWRRPRWW